MISFMTLEIFNQLRLQAQKQRNDSVQERTQRLLKIKNWIIENEERILNALDQDLAKPKFETLITEIATTLGEIKHTISSLKSWMKPFRVPTPLTMFGHKSWVQFENKGVVLIIAPWNYPFFLVMSPLISAVAAGNTVVIKPSELTPTTSTLIHQFCHDCFTSDEIYCALGDKKMTQDLLGFQFHHVFFTGSTHVGRIVAELCAKKLIPTTLELGGKSPVIIDQTADLHLAAEKIFWGKYLNRGQTCVAPDYIYIHESVKTKFIEHYTKIERDKSGCAPTKMINSFHLNRVKQLSQGLWNESMNTLLFEIKNPEHPVMQEEIFGPIVPLLTYQTEDDLKRHLDFDQRPLTMAFFSENKNLIERITRHFPSGSVTINAVNIQVGNSYLPFGGIGSSGYGTSHGYSGFKEFSHQRSFMKQTFLKSMHKIIMPPYTDSKFSLLKKILSWLY
jgi:aldehyde dehydrogenase (NAD+)